MHCILTIGTRTTIGLTEVNVRIEAAGHKPDRLYSTTSNTAHAQASRPLTP